LWVLCIAALGFPALAQNPAPQGQQQGMTTAVVPGPRPPLPPPPEATASQLEATGDQLQQQKLFDDAIDYYRAALKKTPNSAVLRNKTGIAQLQMLRYGEAEKEFKRAAKLDRTYAEPLNNLGVIYYLKKKYGKAIHQYEQALKLKEGAASFHSNLGTAYFEKKEYAKATAEYVRALQLDPEIFDRQATAGVAARMASPEDRARFSYMLAKICAGHGLNDRSLEYLKKAIEEGYPAINDVYKDQEFANLRKDPRFAEIMARREPVVPN